jgi:hypothetical protein
MSSKKDAMKKKLENMHLGERINYGNRRMIIKRKIKNAMEKEKMMQVVYVDSNGLEYSDILEAREINVSREWLERVKSVSVLDGTEETQTCENAKVAIRNIRQNSNTKIKNLLKDKLITEDDSKKAQDEVQKITDGFVAKADETLKTKEKEILTV